LGQEIILTRDIMFWQRWFWP